MLRFRKANHSDLVGLSAFVNSAYRGDSSKSGWTTEAHILDGQRTDPDSLLTQIQGNDQVILLFFENKKFLDKNQNEKIEACVYLRREEQQAYLGMLTVNPQAQAKGKGKFVLDAAEKWAQENWGVGEIRMTVISVRTELIDWYIRRGYQVTAEKERFPYGDERFGIPKREDLEFVVLKKRLQ